MAELGLLDRIGNTLSGVSQGMGGLLGAIGRRQSGMPNLTDQQAMGLLRANAAGTGDAFTQNLIAQQREQQLRDAIASSPLLTPDQQALFSAAPPAQLQQLLNDISSQQLGAGGRNTAALSPTYFTDEQGNVSIGQLLSQGGIRMLDIPQGMEAVGGSMSQDPTRAGEVSRQRSLGSIEGETEGLLARFLVPEFSAAEGDYKSAIELPFLQDRLDIENAYALDRDLRLKEIAALEERKTAAQSAFARARTAEEQNALLGTYFDQARALASVFTTGIIGGRLRNFIGTPAYDLKKTVNTLVANIGFNKLQNMRDLSPTGGALGQVAIQELEALQESLGSLDTAQSQEQFLENLNKVQEQIENSWKRVTEEFREVYGVDYFEASPQELESFLLDKQREVVARNPNATFGPAGNPASSLDVVQGAY